MTSSQARTDINLQPNIQPSMIGWTDLPGSDDMRDATVVAWGRRYAYWKDPGGACLQNNLYNV